MRWLFTVFLAPILMAQSATPLVPEGIHRDTSDGPDICGFKAPDVVTLERRISTDSKFVEEGSTDRFKVLNNLRDFVQFVFPQPGTLPFAMATCRKVVSTSGGSNMSRELHCDGSRDECDRIFLEFRQLDDAVTKALRGD